MGGTAIAGLTYGVATRLAQLFWAGFGLLNYALLAAQPAAPWTSNAASVRSGWRDNISARQPARDEHSACASEPP